MLHFQLFLRYLFLLQFETLRLGQTNFVQLVLSVHERIPTAYRENKGSERSSLRKRGKQLLLP